MNLDSSEDPIVGEIESYEDSFSSIFDVRDEEPCKIDNKKEHKDNLWMN